MRYQAPPPPSFRKLYLNSTVRPPPPPLLHWACPLCWRAPHLFTMPHPRKILGIDFYSGFRKTSQGGGAILKKSVLPVTSKPGSATGYNGITIDFNTCAAYLRSLVSSLDLHSITHQMGIRMHDVDVYWYSWHWSVNGGHECLISANWQDCKVFTEGTMSTLQYSVVYTSENTCVICPVSVIHNVARISVRNNSYGNIRLVCSEWVIFVSQLSL